MGIIDDYYGGYENLAMHTNSDGDIDHEGAYESANFGGGYGLDGSDFGGGYGFGSYGCSYGSDEDEEDHVRFKRSDGSVEYKMVRWCIANGAEELQDGLWAMPGDDCVDEDEEANEVESQPRKAVPEPQPLSAIKEKEEIERDEAARKKEQAERDASRSKKDGKRVLVASQAPGPYMIFCKSERPKVVKANPAYTFGEVGKALGAAWGKLSDAQKAKYKASTSGKRQKAQGSNPEPESARRCEVCQKLLKTIAGKEMHKRDTRCSSSPVLRTRITREVKTRAPR